MQQIQAVSFSKRNLRWVTIRYSSRYILIYPEDQRITTQLVLDRSTLHIHQEDRKKYFVFNEEYQTKSISLLLGIIDLRDTHFLLFAEEVYLAGQYLGKPVYHIASVDFIPFSINQNSDNSKRSEVNHLMNDLKTQVFSFGFYFSFDFDITMTYQQSRSAGSRTVEEFYWNEYLHLPLQQISQQWKIPVSQGYFGVFTTNVLGREIDYMLISRRSKYKSGTRFYARGLDDQGHVANFVESQQIVRVGKYVVSHIMVRGSTPVFWQQRSLSSHVKLTRNKQLTKVAFLNHFRELHKRYGRILCFNLLEAKKSDENLLTKAYQQLFSECFGQIWEYCRYIYFDLHEAINSNKPEKLNLLISQKSNVLQTFSYFLYDTQNLVVKSVQNGVIRVSCLDCLGRSNTMLLKSAFKLVQVALRQQDIKIEQDLFRRSVFEQIDAELKDCHLFTNLFKYTWADNADFISKMYCGTESLSSNLTRLGKTSFFDFIDSSFVTLARLYNYKFGDQLKQLGLDALLGHVKNVRKPSTNTQAWNHLRKTYALKIFITTWNTNAVSPKAPKLDKIFENTKRPEIVVFCMQEMIALNTNNVLNQQQDGRTSEQWKEAISKAIESSFPEDSYIFVDKVELVGIWMAVWINKKWKDSLRGVQKDMVRTGMGGKLGNKGAVLLRIKIYQTSICFMNCHLKAGEGEVEMRMESLTDIHEKAFQQNTRGVQNEAKIETSDFKFLIGDLNTRMQQSAEVVRQKLKEYDQHMANKEFKQAYKILDQLQKYDQLTNLRWSLQPSCKYIHEYKQSPIAFKPTYKFQKNSEEYALKKNRVPSWCDRILLWTDFSYHQRIYTSLPLLDSDHRPVVSEYVVQITKTTNIEKGEEADTAYMKEFRESRFQDFEFL